MSIHGQLLRDVLQWDVRSWARVLPFWEPELKRRPAPLHVLAIGEREGGLSLWAALAGHHVICSDLRPMPAATQELHRRHGVADRIRYAAVDATCMPFPDASFDLVLFKSVIGALGSKPAQATAIGEMHRVLRPGGTLLFAENLTGTCLHAFLRRRFVPWDHYWRYLHWPADRDLFAAFADHRFRTFGLSANLGRSEAQRNLLSHADDLLCPVLPTRWRYILAGICHKHPAPLNP
jgi:SAM-dependent methyltransferase